MNTIYLAEYVSYSFTFRLVGETERQARANLIKALRKHGRDYQCVRDWFCANDINCHEMPLNVAFRDYDEI